MNFTLDDFSNQFYLILFENIENIEFLKNINDRYEKLIIFNPKYILTIYHVLIAVNRAFYNFYTVKKKKAGSIKKEIIYYLTDKKKVDEASKLHQIESETNCYFLLFIDFEKEEKDKIINEIKGKEIHLENFSSICDTNELKKQFEVSDNETLTENGLIGCIYNKIALKDLK